MLKLKRVEIHGFKSFYDRTEMKFHGSGIAAIVGPNGCGKSNLSDAISWVLGEQSAKTLRGARMEDVIFAGTRDRKALGMAAVTITLVPDESALVGLGITGPKTPGENNSTNTVDVDRNGTDSHRVETNRVAASEITISRRLYRSGESEYLINGKQARLRDIQDLFLGTGLGPESYAIIEQGRIGQILSNKPQDRRNLIEEAAGVTKFKTRKRLAEAKLESAKQNLSRVFDILEEVTRQVNSLKRQAAKTKRYGELKEEAIGHLKQLLATKFRVLERDMAKIAIELNLATAQLQSAQASISEGEAAQERVLAAFYATEGELTEARRQLSELKLEAERTRGRLEYQDKQVNQIIQNLASSEQDRESLARQRAEHTEELQIRGAELSGVEHSYVFAQSELAAKSAERQNAENNLTEQERILEGKRQHVLRL
ncbi:MAG: AAA family ATPase, partial [Acidobacteriaceae bacterium]|nr:AAA family ATPase [Acidobacteriaceae bacterium]